MSGETPVLGGIRQTAWTEMDCNVCVCTHTHVSEIKGDTASDLKESHHMGKLPFALGSWGKEQETPQRSSMVQLRKTPPKVVNTDVL